MQTQEATNFVELSCKLLGMLTGGGVTIAVIQTSDIKDWTSIIVGGITGICIIATTLHTIWWKDKKRKRKS
jgi:formate-dependent nitrite reductase membrane component NrfD